MREKYESQSVASLRALAKERGLRHISALKKSELIDVLVADEERKTETAAPVQEKTAQERPVPENLVRVKMIPENPAQEGPDREERGETDDPAPAKTGSEPDGEQETGQKRQGERAKRPAAQAAGEGTPIRERRTSGGRRTENRQPETKGQEKRGGEVRRTENRPQETRRQDSRAGETKSPESRPSESGRTENTRRNGNDARRNAGARYGESDRQANQQNRRGETGGRRQDYYTDRRGIRRENGDDQRGSHPESGERTAFRREYSEEKNAGRREYNEGQRAGRQGDPAQTAQPDRGDRPPMELSALDSGESVTGVLEILSDGYGFLRSNHYLPGENDVYVAPSQIRRFALRTGDIITGNTRISSAGEKYRALLYLESVNARKPSESMKRPSFESMTPIFPDRRIRLERGEHAVAMRIVDLISPVGRGQRGMIVSPPKAGKTTLLKDMARSILANEPDMHIIIMLIDERPEEVTDIREAIVGENVEVLYSTFDELPEHHMKVAEMGIERAKRLVEYGSHVTILLDSITRLARAYNLTVQPSGRTLSGGLDPAALNMPKRFFGAARNMREGGSLTILATALIDTGSKMDDVVYEEFKGTGNMELVLDRKLSERRVFPAIDIQKSGTRREDLLLDDKELEAVFIMRKALNGMKSDEAVENILNLFVRTADNAELVARIRRQRYV